MSETADAQHAPTRSPTWVVVALVLVVLALLAGFALGRTGSMGRVSSTVDVGFARDMQVHHAQAVEMSTAVYRRSENPELVSMALDIITTQQAQIGMMSGWLELWGHTQTSSDPTMAWMGEEHAGSMPGMALEEDIAQLETLPLERMEELYLRLMINHHQGAIPMAAAASEKAESAELARLARGMEQAQASEIEAMQLMLEARGLEREDEIASSGGHESHGGHGG